MRTSADPTSLAAVEIEGLHHYTISVAGLEDAVGWYSRVLGFKLVYQNTRHPWGKVAYMQAPGFVLEMFEIQDPKPVPSYAAGPEPDVDLSVCGHKHFALLHENVIEAVGDLEQLGQKVLSFKRVQLEGMGEFVAAFFADSTGGLIELPQDDVPSRPPAETRPRVGEGPLSIKRLHHVALCAPDRDEAVEWYSDVFGLSVATSFEVPAIGLKSAMMQGPGFWLEIHSKAGCAPVPAERRDPRVDVQTLGNKYFAFGVRDAARTSEGLEKAGVSIVATEIGPGVHRIFISDNSGNPLELFQLLN